MGELLRKVFQTQVEGLVGVIEDGGEILLSEPHPNALITRINSSEAEDILDSEYKDRKDLITEEQKKHPIESSSTTAKLNRFYMQDIINSKENTYFQLGEKQYFRGDMRSKACVVQPYNTFTKRD